MARRMISGRLLAAAVFMTALALSSSCKKGEDEKASRTTPLGEEVDETEAVRKRVMRQE